MADIVIDRRGFIGSAVAGLLVSTSGVRASEDQSTWQNLRSVIFGDRVVVDDGAYATLTAPVRAEDAALVPIDIHVAAPAGDSRTVTALTLVVDENPSPLVAAFKLGTGSAPFDLSTRIRVNSYSFVRVITETSEGALHMSKAFVKAAGGCSAPAVKDPVQAQGDIGKMRFRVFSGTGRDEAQLQIRHPNYSGMQMNQATRLYTPAWFLQHLEVKQGDHVIFSMEGGISLSEDPTFRFTYRPDGHDVSVFAEDSEKNVFRTTFPAGGA